MHFKQPAGTSRGVYTTRKSWFVHLSDGEYEGVGECAPLPDLSCDARPDYGEVLKKVCAEFCQRQDCEALRDYPSMLFGLETALLDLRSNLSPLLFDTAFTRGEVGIPINGLVWMGSYEEMLRLNSFRICTGFEVCCTEPCLCTVYRQS